jgi:hypothetical protein
LHAFGFANRVPTVHIEKHAGTRACHQARQLKHGTVTKVPPIKEDVAALHTEKETKQILVCTHPLHHEAPHGPQAVDNWLHPARVMHVQPLISANFEHEVRRQLIRIGG